MGWSIGAGVGPFRYSVPVGGKHHMRRGTNGLVGIFTGVLVLAAQLGWAALLMVWSAVLFVAWVVKRWLLR